MQIRYYKEYSRYLNRDMEFKVYGHAGRPILIFPCQSGRFFDWEDRNMCNLAAPWIDAVCCRSSQQTALTAKAGTMTAPRAPALKCRSAGIIMSARN